METLRVLVALTLLLLCVLLSSGYAGSHFLTDNSLPIEAHTGVAVLGRNFKIKFGQELTVKGQDLKVKFDSVLEDSRCPAEVDCIWEGDAKILIKVRRDNSGESKMELHTNRKFPQAEKYQRYVIKLVALDPYPKTSVKEKRGDYVATLLIKKQ